MEKVYLGVDVGGTKTAVILSAHPPEALARIEFATLPDQGPERALQLIVESGRSLLAQHSVGVQAVGVSCGSPLDRVKGIVQAPPNLPTWVDVPICRLLGEAFHATCRLENDANAFTFSTDFVKSYAEFLHTNAEDQYVEQKQLIASIKERGGYTPSNKRDAQGKQARGLRGVRIKGTD